MIIVSVCLGLAAISLFWTASRMGEKPGADRAPFLVGGLGLLCMIAAIITTPAIMGDQSECINYGVRAESC